MRFLITAIGSMSAKCAINRLKDEGYFVVGCDIYPGEWHYETKLCDVFVQAPLATKQDEYVQFLIDTCHQFELDYIIPLTDIEIDVINRQRSNIEDLGIVLCMQSSEVLDVARDKFKLSRFCEQDSNIPSARTCLLSEQPTDFKYPCIAKPYNGRSSEGLIRNASKEQLQAIEKKEDYIIQEQLEGDVFCVDYCRSAMTGVDCVVPRQELLRTSNGAGLTVQMVTDEQLIKLVSYIKNKLNINGCVNMEFILNNGKYYLIDINPRFSAGVAFSVLSGYDMIINHIRCFCNQSVDAQIAVEKKIIIKIYEEVIV